MNLSDYIHERLRREGVTQAFGVPGSFVMPLWQRFKSDPEIILARHESGAVFMADGWSRATGRLGVALATIGPGLTNCVTGVASAYRDSVPLLLITGQAPTASFGRGAFLESYVLDRSFSPASIFAPITKKSMEIVDLANAGFLVDSALALAQSGRPGPVHVSVPVDLQYGELAHPPRPKRAHEESGAWVGHNPGRAAVRSDALVSAAAKLATASRPLLLVGWGSVLARAGHQIEAFADELNALVVSTAKAVSCLPGLHPRLLGHLGPGQRSDLLGALGDYDPDVILVLGASMSHYYAEPLRGLLERAVVIRADIDGDQLGLRVQPDVPLHGDVATVVSDLRVLLKEQPAAVDRPMPELAAAFQGRGVRAGAAQELLFRDAVSMSGVVARLAAMLPEDAVVVPDAGNHWLDTLALYTPAGAGGLQLNCGLGPMGWAIGAAVGMALGDRTRKIVCVTGDGSMLMHGVELSVAAEHQADVLAVVFNNRGHGRVRLGQKSDLDGDPLATSIPAVDFTTWMTVMGIPAFKVTSPRDVAPAFADALAVKGTSGIEVECDPDEVPACLRDWIETDT